MCSGDDHRVAAGQEAAALGSLLELRPGPGGTKYITQLQKEIRKTESGMEKQLESYYRLLCARKKVAPAVPGLTREEKQASAVIPRPTARVSGYYQNAWMDGIDREDQRKLMKIGYRKVRELRALIDGKRSVLEITRTLDAEYERPTTVEDVMNYITLLKMAGLVEI